MAWRGIFKMSWFDGICPLLTPPSVTFPSDPSLSPFLLTLPVTLNQKQRPPCRVQSQNLSMWFATFSCIFQGESASDFLAHIEHCLQ